MSQLTEQPTIDLVSLFSGMSLAETEATFLAQEQVEAPVIHRFGPGLYIRELSLPAGTLAIGHEQRYHHMNVFLKGRVIMLNENGTTTELVAPMVFVGNPGRKIGYIAEDTVWQNIYATTETDVETLESMFLIKSDDWKADEETRKGALKLKHTDDRDDYLKMLDDLGVSEEIVRSQSENEADQIPFPAGGYKVMIADSAIEGKGLFATATIEDGEVIAPARIAGMRTPAGRYTNHAAEPNAVMVKRDNGDIYLVASSVINGCHGGQPGDEITIDYRQAVSVSIGERLKCLE